MSYHGFEVGRQLLNLIRLLIEARSIQDLHCLSLDASICDTDTKCGIHFFRVLLFYCFV